MSTRLSDEQIAFYSEILGVKKLYLYADHAPTRELDRNKALRELQNFKDSLISIKTDGHIDRVMTEKIKEIEKIIKIVEDGMEEYSDDEDEIQRYFSYHLDGVSVGLAFVTQDAENIGNIYIGALLSHPGVRGASSAILEEMMRSSGPEPKISLSSEHGTLAVYRRLGFSPQDTNMFTPENLKDYDAMFIGKTEEEIAALPQTDVHAYLRYKSMSLQPHLSNLWEIKSGAWHYIPDGDTYLTSSPE